MTMRCHYTTWSRYPRWYKAALCAFGCILMPLLAMGLVLMALENPLPMAILIAVFLPLFIYFYKKFI
jgi:hypothetical protein